MSFLMGLMTFFRVVQLLCATVFLVLWAWTAAHGYNPIVSMMTDLGITLSKVILVLGFVAVILTLAISVHGIYYGVRDRYSNHRTRFHMLRLFLDAVALTLFLGTILIEAFLPTQADMVLIPADETPDPLLMLNIIGGVRLALLISFVLTKIGILVEALCARVERTRIHRTQDPWETKPALARESFHSGAANYQPIGAEV